MSLLFVSLVFQAACMSQYEEKDLKEFLEGLWMSLKREVCLKYATKWSF